MKPIAMKCTQQQYDKIRPILLKNGFKEDNITSFKDYPYLINNWGSRDYKLGNGESSFTVGREMFKKWNEDTFLEYCDIKKEFTLPEKWCIKRDKDNYKVINEYFNKLVNTDYYTSKNSWIYNKKLNCDAVGGEYVYVYDSDDKEIPKYNKFTPISFEQFKKYVLKQEENMFTIEDLAEGKCAVINDNTLEELEKVLELAFPEDNSCLGGTEKYYFQLSTCQYKWVGSSKTNLPSQSVKDFLKQINMEKEIIGYKLIKPEYAEAALKIANEDCTVSRIEISNLYNLDINFHDKSVPSLKEAGVLDLWFEPIYKTQEVKYTMGSNNDTFELVVRDGRVFHKQEDITSYVKNVQERFSPIIKTYDVKNYDFVVKDVILSKTGCENKETLLSQWLNIKL